MLCTAIGEHGDAARAADLRSRQHAADISGCEVLEISSQRLVPGSASRGGGQRAKAVWNVLRPAQRDERAHRRLMAARRRRKQRGLALRGCAMVHLAGRSRDKRLHNGRVPGLGRKQQRPRAQARLLRETGTSLNQLRDARERAARGGGRQSGPADLVRRIHVRASRKQRGLRAGVPVATRQKQRLPLLVVRSIDRCAAEDQRFDDVGRAALGSKVQRRVAMAIFGFDFRALHDEFVDDVGRAAPCSNMEYRIACTRNTRKQARKRKPTKHM